MRFASTLFCVLLLLVSVLSLSSANMAVVGGFGDFKPADDDVKARFSGDGVKASVAAAVGAESVDTFEIIEFKSQVVAGTNYELKAKVDGVAYNIKAFAPLPHTGEPISISSAEKAE